MTTLGALGALLAVLEWALAPVAPTSAIVVEATTAMDKRLVRIGVLPSFSPPFTGSFSTLTTGPETSVQHRH
ncbi:hypothetical protein [Phycicoccus sp. SLBN-51]|uniref:hypothetical protein n=1 Tax=Phycicoccus sp. SLBN-51 TaxID=2768447 RepID=UPI00135CE0D0|nr:hypothetical protein [Phycicoccus sp. SLBN-51]